MGTDIHPYVEVRKNGAWTRAKVDVPRDRNYFAFGKLANVRNGSGFAGCDMGDPLRPIAEPRGLPPDTSIQNNEIEEWRSSDYVSLGDHSFSWVMLSELLAIDYNAKVTMRGMISPEQYEHFTKYKGQYPPQTYCGWTTQKDWKQVEWQEPLMTAAPLLLKIIASICHLGKPEDVRLVFGFDS
jgi:hypothetical protein